MRRPGRRSLPTFSLLVAVVAFGCPAADSVPVGDATSPDTEVARDVDLADPGDRHEPPPAPLDDDARFFAKDRVIPVRLTLDPGDWESLRSEARSLKQFLDEDGAGCLDRPFDNPFAWYPADATIDGFELEQIAVRKKGFGSLDAVRPPLKLSLDRYVEGRHLGGMARMTLNNAKQDPARVSQCLVYAVFAAAGVPAPRCGYVHLVVNGEDLGLFVHVEPIKKPFLRRHFAYEAGALYEGASSDFVSGWLETFLQKHGDGVEDRAPLEAVRHAADTPDSELLDALGAVLDLEAFYAFWAVEVLVNQEDGYAQNHNNFFVYRDLDGRFRFIPWGADSSLFWPGGDGHALVKPQGWLAQRLLDHPDGHERFSAKVEQLLESVWDPELLQAEFDRQSSLVAPFVLPADRPLFDEVTAHKRAFIAEHPERVRAGLASLPDGPSGDPTVPCLQRRGRLAVSFDIVLDLPWPGVGSLESELNGAGTWAVGAIANATLESDLPGRAQIVVRGATEDGGELVASIALDVSAMRAGATVPLTLWPPATGRVTIIAPDGALVRTDQLVDGALQIESVEAAAGGRLVGALAADVVTVF